jgi:hypothetical protein
MPPQAPLARLKTLMRRSALLAQESPAEMRNHRILRRSRRKKLAIAALVLLVLIAAGFIILVRHWPFTQTAVAAALEETVPGKVQIGAFQRTYFPGPGCIAEGVVITGSAAEGSPVLIMVQKLTVETGFLDLFRNSIREVRAEGLRVMVPPGSGLNSGNGQSPSPSPNRVVSRFVADGAVVEFERRGKERTPLRFRIARLTLLQRGSDSPITFQTELLNPEPPGQITADGEFGPWKADDPGSTALSGSYRFEKAKLDVFKGIAGTLSSVGKFSGSLARVNVEGTTAVPDFEVKQAGHRVSLKIRFAAVVDGTNGNTVLQSLDVRLENTSITAQVNVKEQSNAEGKLTSVNAIGRGRVQDLLRLFSKDTPPALSGPIRFEAEVTFPSGGRPFLQKVALVGDFSIDGARFSKPASQAGLDTLSARAQGHKVKNTSDAPDVAGDLQSHVVLENGIATFSGLTFHAPGASAQLSGTYNLVNERVKLQGSLQTEASLSQATTGVKAILLKPLDPIFKRKSAGAVVGVSITGTYAQPSFGIDLDAHK